MKLFGTLTLALAALAVDSYAVETRFWQQTDQSDFEKGTLTNLSLRSDGRLFLAPIFREVFDPSLPYIWALAADGKGGLYAGGGGLGNGKTKLFAIDATGKGRTLAELDGLEIHSIAVASDGQVYAATDPDGKVYKVSPQGKVELFYDPHAKYIWALAFNKQGDLFVATGDQGEIHRVDRSGKGSVFFKTGETHARSMAIDAAGNLIVGTDPGGLILRVSASGNGFVLFQTPKREVTAVAIDASGAIYASAVGSRSTTALAQAAPAPAAPPPSGVIVVNSARPPATAAAAPAISGGTEVYRITPDGSPRKVWTNSQDIVYAIGFDAAGLPLFGTGNRGKIYRLDSPTINTQLIDASPTQVTSFASGPGGKLYAATGNIGRIYEIGQATAAKGTFESEVFDASAFTYWGRLAFRGTPASAKIFTRSGNLNRPQENWSPWAPLQAEGDTGAVPCARCLNGRVASPSARFLQYKVELAGSGAPELASVEIAYKTKNVAPVVEDVEITAPNYKLPAPATPTGPSNPTLSLPALGQHSRSASVSVDASSTLVLTYSKGQMGVRWTASDENGDALSYTVEIRGVGETTWKLIKDKVKEKYVSWDGTAFADGEYEIRVTASDLPSNVPTSALSGSLTTDPFLIDNTPPTIQNLAATATSGKIQVQWKARDARSIIDRAEYSLNGADWSVLEPKARLSDAPETEYELTVDRVGTGPQTIAVRVTDAYDNQAVAKITIP